MFGRHKKQASGEEERIQVDAALESDLARVEQSVAEYLKDPTDTARHRSLRRWNSSTIRRIRVTRTRAPSSARGRWDTHRKARYSARRHRPGRRRGTERRAARASGAREGRQERGPWADARHLCGPAVRQCHPCCNKGSRGRRSLRWFSRSDGLALSRQGRCDGSLDPGCCLTRTPRRRWRSQILSVIAGVWFVASEVIRA